MNIKTYLVKILILIIISLSLHAEDKIKIGVVAGYSGPWASYGQAYMQAIKLSGLDKIAEVIYEDDQFMPRKTVSAVRKLIDIDKVDLLIIGDSVTTKAVGPIIKKNKIPTIAWAVADKTLKNNDYLLRFWVSKEKEQAQITRFGEYIPKEKTLIVVSEHNYSSRFGKLIKAVNPEAKLEEVNFDFHDYRSLILKNQSKNYVLCLTSGHNGLFVKELAALRLTGKIYSCDFIESADDQNYLKDINHSIIITAPKMEKDFMDKVTQQDNFNHTFSIATFYTISKIFIKIINGDQNKSIHQRFLNPQGFSSAFVNTKVVKTVDDYFVDSDFTRYLLENSKLTDIGYPN